MASLTHPSATNYHLQSLPRSKMNPLSNTNYSRSLAAIALANHSAALNQLSALNSSASASSSTTDFSGPPPLGDARMSALLLREPNDVSVTSSPLGSPNAPPWPHHHFNVGAAAALAGSHAHHNNSYFSPPSDHHLGQGFQGAAATNIETALKKLGECSRIAATDTCLRDFNGMSHQQLSLSSVQPLHHLRSSTEATNIGRFGGVSTMGSTSQQQQQQQQQQLLRDNLAATPSSRNDWSAIQQCTDPNLSFASSMAALGIPSAADSMRGSLSARAILLGGRGSNRAQQQPESYMLAGNAAEVLNDGGCLSSRMLASLGNGSQQDNSCLLAAARNGDVGGLADDAILQEMIGSYNAGNAVASSVMNAHLHSLPSSPNSQHFLNSGGAMQAGIEATLNGATDWAALLMDTGAGSPHPGMDSGLSKGNLSAPAMAAGPRGGLSSLFTSESGFAERTAKMLFHAAAEGQIQGDILGQPNNSLHLTATFLDGASSMNFAASGGIESTHAGASHLQPDIPAAAAGSSGSPLQSPGFGGKRATLLTSNSTRNRLEDSVRDKHQLGTSPGRLAGTDNLSDPGRMWRPSNNGCAAKETGKQSHQTGGAGAGGGLTRTLSGNSRGSAGMLDSLSGRAAKDALELEMEQCSSMSAMLDDLPLPERRFTKSGRKLSRTSSPSVSTMMDLAAMEPGTGNSSACNSASERGDTPADDKKSDVPVREEPSRSLLLVKGKPALSANQDIGEAGGENSSSTKQEVKENSGDSQGKKRKDRAPEEKLPGGKTSTTSSRTIPVKENNKIEEADAANRSKRSRGSTSDPDPVRGRPGDTRSRSGSDNSSDSAAGASAAKDHAKPPEAPKPDYIHVRARRGQATDSHSLAERVRREKISERMKYLQDLVPGCSKVTGKAMMLDEIINYVQSLQRQVEFLSMKLQSLNPRTDFSMESLLSTEHSRGFTQGGQQQLMIGSESITIPSSAYPQLHPQQQAIAMQQLAVTCGLDMRSLGTQLDTVAGGLRRSLVSPAAGSSITMAQSARDPFEETVSPVSTVWDGELHSVVQMGYAQNRLSSLASSSLRGSLPPGNMKLER